MYKNSFIFVLAFAAVLFAVSAPSAHATAESDYQTALIYLQDTTNLDASAALTYLHSAIAGDDSHAAAHVFAAILELAQIVDDRTLVGLRLNFSNGSDSKNVSDFVTRAFGRGEEADSMLNYRHYQWGTDTKFSTAQAVISRILSDTFTHIEAHLIKATYPDVAFDLPKNLFDESKTSDTRTIDKTELLALRSALLAIKAALIFVTSYDFDVSDTPDYVAHDTISVDSFLANHSQILSRKTTWDSAWQAILVIDTLLYDAGAYLLSESDNQDTNFLRSSNIDTSNSRFIKDTEIYRLFNWHSDTNARLAGGDSLVDNNPHKVHAGLSPVAVVPKTAFSNPPDRYSVNEFQGVRHRGLEWNDQTPVDPTFGGIFPGMSINKIFLYAYEPDTYFVVNSSQTIDLNSLFSSNQSWQFPKIVDIEFASTELQLSFKRRAPGSVNGNFWSFDMTPATSGHHVRFIFDNPTFYPWETFKIKRPGDQIEPYVRIVPWVVSSGTLSDAGSSSSNFSSYFSSFTVKHAWQNYDADTLQMFAMANGGAQFDSIATSTVLDATNDTTLILGTATKLGWFATGATATGTDSYFIFPLYQTISGNPSTLLDNDFAVGVYKLTRYADTQYGALHDYNFEPQAGVTVTFSISDYPSGATGHSIDTSSAVTNSGGVAYTRLTLGNKGGIYAVLASLSADSGSGEAVLIGVTKAIKQWPGDAWYIYSLPRRPSSLTPAVAMDASSFSSDVWKMYDYDITLDDVAEPSTLEMGRGYWLKTLEDGYVALDTTTATELTETQYIALDAGWNLIGMPFDVLYPVEHLMVQASNGSIVTIDTAVDSGLLYAVFYSYNGSSYEQCPDGTFGIGNCVFYPFEGQWVNILTACTIVIPPLPSGEYPPSAAYAAPRLTSASYRPPVGSASIRSSRLLSSAPLASPRRDNWTVQLIAQQGKHKDMLNAVGVRSNPPDPILKAPRPPAGVHLTLNQSGSAYSSSFRSTGEKPEWSFDVYSSNPGLVTVRAVNVASVPSDIPLTLTDIASGSQVDLRKSSSYSYVSTVGEARAFKLSNDEPSLFNKITYPAVCLITRTFGTGSRVAEHARVFRDILLESDWGRRLTALYYGEMR